MASKQASLILQLVDQVSGPAKGIAASLRSVNAAIGSMRSGAMAPARALGAIGQSFRRQTQEIAVLSGGMALGIGKMARNVYELEKQLNISVAAGDLKLGERQELMKTAVKLNAEYAATSAEIVAGANELLKSGLSYEQATGSLRGVLDTAQAMGVSIPEASGAIVTAMVAQKMAMKDADEAMRSSMKMADLYAFAMKETAKATLEDFATSGKYFNPVAAAIGLSPEQTMAYQIALAKSGIFGSSAGTGLRAAPVRIAAPTPQARAAFGRLGIDPSQYVGGRSGDATGDTIAAALEAMGFSTDGLEAAFDKLLADPALKGSTARFAAALIDQFGDDIGAVTAEDRIAISDAIQTALTAGVSQVDLYGVLKALKDRGAGIGDYAAIFGLHHASKMQAIDIEILKHYLDATESEAEGTARRMREQMMTGIVEVVNQLQAAFEALGVAIGDSGLLKDAIRLGDSLQSWVQDVSQSNPELLRFGAYSALALAAMAPLGFAISGVASSLGLMVNPLSWVVAGLGTLAYYNWGKLTVWAQSFKELFVKGLSPETLNAIAKSAEKIRGIFTALTGGDGASDMWATSVVSAAQMASGAVNDFVRGVIALGNSQFMAGFVSGVTKAFNAITEAVKLLVDTFDRIATALGPVLKQLDESSGGVLGEIAGQMFTYSAAFAIGAASIALAAGAIGKLTRALYALSGAQMGMSALGWLLGMGGGKGGGGGKAAALGGAGLLRGRAGGILAAAAALTGVMYLLKDWQGGVWKLPFDLPGPTRDPTKPVSNPLTDAVTKKREEEILAGRFRLSQRPEDIARLQHDADQLRRFGTLSEEERRQARVLREMDERKRKPMQGPPMELMGGPGFWSQLGAGFDFAIDSLIVKSNKARADMQRNLEVEARPVVDTSSIDAAISKASTFRRMLEGMGSVGPSVPSGPAFGGPRAAGGPVQGGRAYLVGEEGPEIFAPGRGGAIVPNHALGGGVTMHNTFNISGGGDAEKIARQIVASLDRALVRSRETEMDGRPIYEFG